MIADKKLIGILAMLRSLGRASAGNVLPLAAGTMIVAAALVGGAVDMGRSYLVQSRLLAACDAAVLAGDRAALAETAVARPHHAGVPTCLLVVLPPSRASADG